MLIAEVTALLVALHIDFRSASRLLSVSKEFRLRILPLLTEWISHSLLPARLILTRDAALHADAHHSRYILPLPYTEFIEKYPSGRIRCRHGEIYAAKPQPSARAWNMVRTNVCRECFKPTRAKARLSGGRGFVLVCRECSKDPTSYSALIDRENAARLTDQNGWRMKKTTVLSILGTLMVVRRGGNRALLYWRHEVIAAFRYAKPNMLF